MQAMLHCCMPQRDNIIDPRTESKLIFEYMYELQTMICGELEHIATRWVRGRDGKRYVDHIEDARKKGERRRRLSVKEIEEYFEFTVEDYAAIWFPISFVLDPGFWNPNGPDRLDYDHLRLGTLAMICRIIVVLLTGKVQQRVLSNNMRFRILDSTCSDAEERPWPSMVSSAGRPDGTSAWQEEIPTYPQYNSSPMHQHLWARIEPSERSRAIQGDKQHDDDAEVRSAEGGIIRERDHTRQPEVLVEASQRGGGAGGVGRESAMGFTSLERAGVEDPTISGIEVQGLINDVEAQLLNTSRKDIPNEVQNEVQKEMQKEMQKEIQKEIQKEMQREDVIMPPSRHVVEHREVIYETDEEVSAESEDETVDIPMSMGSEFSMGGHDGLLTLDVLAELDGYHRDDRELDGRIQELLRPTQYEEDVRSYILNQAVRLTFLGPLGMARWNIEACMEIVRRCEDLYLLIDKKIDRAQQVIQKLEAATVSAGEAVERLDYLRGMLGTEVDKLSKTKKAQQKAIAQAKQQREQQILRSMNMRSIDMRSVDIGVLGCQAEFVTPTKQAVRGMARNHTSLVSLQCPEGGMRSVWTNKSLWQEWTVERRARGLVRSNSGISADESLGRSPSHTVGPMEPMDDAMWEDGAKHSDLPRELANEAGKGKSKSGWHEETVDDEELRLGTK